MKKFICILLLAMLCTLCAACRLDNNGVATSPTYEEDGSSKEHPIYTTLEKLKQEPEEYINKWIWTQAYWGNSGYHVLQNKKGPVLINDEINPEIITIGVIAEMDSPQQNQIFNLGSYMWWFGIEETPIQVLGQYREQIAENGQKYYQIQVEEMILTDWEDDGGNVPAIEPSNEKKPTHTIENVKGEGTEEEPYQITIDKLKQSPKRYDKKWVEFDAYLYCEQNKDGQKVTLLQIHQQEVVDNRDKIGMVLTEYDDGYDEMKELVEEALRENKTIKVRVKGMFELNPYHLKGDVAEKTQFLSMQTFRRIE